MHILARCLLTSVTITVLSACTLGNFQSEYEAVQLLTEADVTDCELIDTITEKSSDRWASTRTDPKIVNELLTLARREAIKLGGNTIVEKSELILGRQTFTIYNCS